MIENYEITRKTIYSFMCSRLLAYKRVNGITPSYLNLLLKTNSDVHSRNNRFSNLYLLCPTFKRFTEAGRTFSVRTTKDWNALPTLLRKSINVKCFKEIFLNLF